jgi:hypothetical protein
MTSSLFWDITPCSLLKHVASVFRVRNKTRNRAEGGFLFGLFFDPEDGGDMFL